MSTITQYYGAGIPIGGTSNITFAASNSNPLFTAADGSQWYTYNPNSPFDYTSDYSYLPTFMLSSGSLFGGPVANLWAGTQTIYMAYDSSTNTYCTSGASGTAAKYLYYQSNNGGNTWNTYATPTSGSVINYSPVVFTAGKFFMGSSTTTNGLAYSTDGGVTWTRATKNSGTVVDIISNGANNVVILPSGAGTASYSTNGGTSFTNATIGGNAGSGYPGGGCGTWNAGASLFVVPISTAGQYATSPTGATWTLRSQQTTYQRYSSYLIGGTKMASNTTTTIAMGLYGFYCTSTDCLTWSNHGFISNYTRAASSYPDAFYHDGTRFVAVFGSQTWYSTDGTTWTEGTRIGLNSALSISSGVLFGFVGSTSQGSKTKVIRVANVASSTKQTVIGSLAHSVSSGATRAATRVR